MVKRGYDGESVQRRINKATGADRDSLLVSHEKVDQQTLPLVISFHPDLPNLARVLHDHQCVIKHITTP